MTFNRLATNLATNLGSTASSGSESPRTILGALYVDHWEAVSGVGLVSGTVQTWTSALGRVLTAPAAGQRPAFSADGTRFGGKSVVQCAVSGSLCLRGVALSQLFANSTRPWAYTIGRTRNAIPGAFSTLTDAGVDAVSDEMTVRINPTNQIEAFCSGIGTTTGAAVDVNRHSYQQYLDGTNLNLAIDNVVVGTFSAPGVNTFHAVTAVGIGCDASNPIHLCDASVACYVLATTRPSNAQIAALEIWASARYPA